MTLVLRRYEVKAFGNDGKLMNTYNFEGRGGARQAESKLNEVRRGGRRAIMKREAFRDGKWVEEANIT